MAEFFQSQDAMRLSRGCTEGKGLAAVRVLLHHCHVIVRMVMLNSRAPLGTDGFSKGNIARWSSNGAESGKPHNRTVLYLDLVSASTISSPLLGGRACLFLPLSTFIKWSSMECALLSRGALGCSTLALKGSSASVSCAGSNASVPQRSLLLRQHCIKGNPFLKGTALSHAVRPSRQQYTRGSVRGAVSLAASEAGVPPPKLELGNEIELTGLQPILRGFSQPVKLGVCALLVLGLGGAGGVVAGRNWLFGLIGGAGLGLGAAYAIDKQHKSLAAIELHNTLVKHPNVLDVSRDDIHAIAQK